jgi:hypothetical protein
MMKSRVGKNFNRFDRMLIRSFRNDDLEKLHQIWCEHWELAGLSPAISVRQLENAVFSRLFFQRTGLVVACLNDSPVGWCQRFLPVESGAAAIITAVCVGKMESSEDRVNVATALLESASKTASGNLAVELGVGGVDGWNYGYSGISPLGPGVGVPATDLLQTQVARSLGFTATRSFSWFRVAVSNFRPPISRDIVNLRRTSQVRYSVAPCCDLRTAQSRTHLDEKRISLIQAGRSSKESLDFFLTDQHSEVMESDCCMVALDSETQERGLSSEQLYLLSTLIRDAASHQIRYVDTSFQTDTAGLLIDQLRSIQFFEQLSGAIWQSP